MNITSWIALGALALSVVVNVLQARSRSDQMNKDIGNIQGQLEHLATKEDVKGVALKEDVFNVKLEIFHEIHAAVEAAKLEIIRAVKNEQPSTEEHI